MITFSNINKVIELINHLKVSNSKEAESAVNCIKIEQIKPKITRFTTYEPTVGYFQRDLYEEDKDCFGQVGTTFLIDFISFRDVVGRMSNSVDSQSKLHGLSIPRLTIKHESGMMVLHTNLRITESGAEESKGTQVLSLYPGQPEDFPTLAPHSKTAIGNLSASDFDKLVKTIVSSGEFTDSNESYAATVNSKGRLVILTLENEIIKAFTTRKCESIWFEASKPAYCPEDKQYYIEGRLLDRLKDMNSTGQDINIYSIAMSFSLTNDDEEEDELTLIEWLLFETTEATIACRVLEEFDLALERKYSSFTDLYDQSKSFGYRTISPFDLKNTFDVMHDKKIEVLQQLSLFELEDEESGTPVKFIVLDYKDKLGKSKDSFPIQKYSNDDFPPVCFRYTQIDGLSKTLGNYYNLHKNEELVTPLVDLKIGEIEIDCNGTTIIRAIAFVQFEDDDGLVVHCQPTSIEELEE